MSSLVGVSVHTILSVSLVLAPSSWCVCVYVCVYINVCVFMVRDECMHCVLYVWYVCEFMDVCTRAHKCRCQNRMCNVFLYLHRILLRLSLSMSHKCIVSARLPQASNAGILDTYGYFHPPMLGL